MLGNQARILLREDDLSTEWFRIRNINKWIQKLWKPSFIGIYVGKYEGGWKDGKMHGTGTLKISRIFGGNMSSYGLVPFPFSWKLIDQGKYEGEWKNGKEHGQGTYYSSSGGKLVGRFKRGIPWNTTDFDEDQNFIGLHVRGVEREIIPLKPKY